MTVTGGQKSLCQMERQQNASCDISLLFITFNNFIQAIYNYTPNKNNVSMVYGVAVILQLQFLAHVMLLPMLNVLYFYISTFRRMCAVPNMAVVCSSLILCFPGMMLGYYLKDFEMVPVAPFITGITSVFTFHVCCVSIKVFIF